MKIQIVLTCLVPTYPGCPGKEAVKDLSDTASVYKLHRRLLMIADDIVWICYCMNLLTCQHWKLHCYT